jgi:3-hydroxy acid dehydrogenase / malonic semialdehyde reductase
MEKQTVLITGASSGIGEAIAHAFAKAGARLILTARRQSRLDALAADLQTSHGAECLVRVLDVTLSAAVADVIASLPADWQAIDVLVNNAGLASGLQKMHQTGDDDIDKMIDTNLKGLLYVTRNILPGMVDRNRGHVINIGSIAGHEAYANGTIYCATKAAVKQLTKALKMDLLGTAVRVTSIDPGMVETEFSVVRFGGDETRAKKVYENMNPLTPADIADAVLYCASRPAHVNVSEMIILATDQSSATTVHRHQGS